MEAEDYFVIKDINPRTNTHLLIVSKKHVKSINEIETNSQLPNKIFEAAQKLANLVEKPEYKLQIHTGKSAGQEIFHFHVHFMSSSKLKSTA